MAEDEEVEVDKKEIAQSNGNTEIKPQRTPESINIEVKDLCRTLEAAQGRYEQLGKELGLLDNEVR